MRNIGVVRTHCALLAELAAYQPDGVARDGDRITHVNARSGHNQRDRLGVAPEIAFHNSWITAEGLRERAEPLKKSGYGEYLLSLIEVPA